MFIHFILFLSFLKSTFTGVMLVHKNTQVSSAQFYDTMICILHCVPTIQSELFFCQHIFDRLYALLPLFSHPYGNHQMVVCVYEFSFAYTVCSSVFSHFISHIWAKLYSCWLFLMYTFNYFLFSIFGQSEHILEYKIV